MDISVILYLCCCYFSFHIVFANDVSIGNVTTETSTWKTPYPVDCTRLRIGQYRCVLPDIDTYTQLPFGCSRKKTVTETCYLSEGLVCKATNITEFYREVPCKHTNGKSWQVALLLSIFLGTFGIDRFYLGYPAIGLIKFSTLGFMFLGQLIDIILIATQIVHPADGSDYIIDFFGCGLNVLSINNDTYRVPNDNW